MEAQLWIGLGLWGCPVESDMGDLEAMSMPQALCHVPHTIPEQCGVTMHIVLLKGQERGVPLL